MLQAVVFIPILFVLLFYQFVNVYFSHEVIISNLTFYVVSTLIIEISYINIRNGFLKTQKLNKNIKRKSKEKTFIGRNITKFIWKIIHLLSVLQIFCQKNILIFII